MNDTYNTENTATRERLYALTAHLSDADLNRTIASGWTVATVLVHLAFWDRYALTLLEAWEQSGRQPSLANVEAINDAVELLSLAIPPQKAVELARTAADLTDQKVAAIASDLAQGIEQKGHARLLRRALHRGEHLDQIERALSTTRA